MFEKKQSWKPYVIILLYVIETLWTSQPWVQEDVEYSDPEMWKSKSANFDLVDALRIQQEKSGDSFLKGFQNVLFIILCSEDNILGMIQNVIENLVLYKVREVSWIFQSGFSFQKWS